MSASRPAAILAGILVSLLAATTTVVVSSPPAAAVPQTSRQWRVVEVPLVPGAVNNAGRAINALGQVAGDFGGVDGIRHPFFWDGQNTPVDLGMPSPGGLNAFALAMNDSGWVAGHTVVNAQGWRRGFVWDRQSMHVIDPVTFGSTANSEIFDINASGAAVGSRTGACGFVFCQNAILWTPQGLTDLPVVENAAGASGINDAGVIVGGSIFGGQDGPLIWRGGQVARLSNPPPSFAARRLNAHEEIVGWSFGGVSDQPYIWTATGSRALNLPPAKTGARALDINASGHVIGFATPGFSIPGLTFAQQPLFWDNTAVYELNSSLDASSTAEGWAIYEVSGLNDSDQMSGTGFKAGVGFRAVRLDPVNTSVCNTNNQEAQAAIDGQNKVKRPAVGTPAYEFEVPYDVPSDPPAWSLIPSGTPQGIDIELDRRLKIFKKSYDSAVSKENAKIKKNPAYDPTTLYSKLKRSSGYRPTDYQQHFRALQQISLALGDLENTPGTFTQTACQALFADLNKEIDTKHVILRKKGATSEVGYRSGVPLKDQLPAVASLTRSAHPNRLAMDVSRINVSRPPPGFEFDWKLIDADLWRPYGNEDRVHIQFLGQSVQWPIDAVGNPPDESASQDTLVFTADFALNQIGPAVRLLVTDPQGRRVGYDPVSGQAINEVGADAWYLGSDSRLQAIVFWGTVPGVYQVSGVGVIQGLQTIRAWRTDEDGGTLAESTWSAASVPNAPIAPVNQPVVAPVLDSTRPVVTAPAPIVVAATELTGARPAQSAALAAFVNAGSATDNLDPSPVRLVPTREGTDISAFTLFPVGTSSITFRYQDASTNVGSATSTVTVLPPATPNWSDLIQNGNFSNDLAGWQTFATPAPEYLTAAVSGGVLEFNRAAPPPGTSNQATVFQATNVALAEGTALQAHFDIGNSGGGRRRISVLILNHPDFSDLSVCTFWIAPHTARRTYSMTTHTTREWTNAAIYFYAATAASDGGSYQLDDVALSVQPGGATNRTNCIDPTSPAASGSQPGLELLTNGGFDSGLAGWSQFGQLQHQVTDGVFEFYRPGASPDPAGVILQPTTTPVAVGEILTASFQLGNSSDVRKRVTVLLHDLDFSDLSACTFWLEPGKALAPYTMRTFATEAWSQATLSLYAATPGDETWIEFDNASLKKTPNTAIGGSDCLEFDATLGSSPATQATSAPAPATASTTSPQLTASTIALADDLAMFVGIPIVRMSGAPEVLVSKILAWVTLAACRCEPQVSRDGVEWHSLETVSDEVALVERLLNGTPAPNGPIYVRFVIRRADRLWRKDQ